MPAAYALCMLNGCQWPQSHCISGNFQFLVCRDMKSGRYVENNIVSLSTKVIMQKHLVCNSCAAFPECLDRAQCGGKALRWLEGRVAGRMFRRTWPSFLPLLSLCSFLSFLRHSLPSSFHPKYLFQSFSSLWRLHFCLGKKKKNHLANPVFPSLSRRTLGQQWQRRRVRKGSPCWRSRDWER